jgi:hypothetical protein
MDIQSVSTMNIHTMQSLMGGLKSVNVGGESGGGGWNSNIGKTKNEAAMAEKTSKGLQDISEVLGSRNSSPLSGGDSGGGGGMVADDILKSLRQSRMNAESVNTTHPFQLSSDERINGRPAYGGDSTVGSPATLGDTISQLLENVHDKSVAYEEQSNSMANKTNSSPVDEIRESMSSSYQSLSGKAPNQKDDTAKINESIDKYIGVMNDSYEYSIFTSMTIDVGKDVSQTANNLTKG